MRTVKPIFKTLFIFIALSFLANSAFANEINGKKIAFDRKKGNCLACHMIDDGDMSGNIGPPLVTMKIRFPDRAVLKAQIWNSTAKNPSSIMPPFGKHYILSNSEIEEVIDYLYTL